MQWGGALSALETGAENAVKDTIWYTQLKAIADVKTIDKNRLFLPDKFWINTPITLWACLFNILFYWRLGKFASIVMTIYVGFILCVGTAHNVGILKYFFCRDESMVGFHYGTTLFAFLWPMVMVAAGAWVQWGVKRFLRYQVTSLGKAVLSDAERTIEETTQAIKAVAVH